MQCLVFKRGSWISHVPQRERLSERDLFRKRGKGAGPAKWPGRPTRRDELSGVWRAAVNAGPPAFGPFLDLPNPLCTTAVASPHATRLDGHSLLTADFLTAAYRCRQGPDSRVRRATRRASGQLRRKVVGASEAGRGSTGGRLTVHGTARRGANADHGLSLRSWPRGPRNI